MSSKPSSSSSSLVPDFSSSEYWSTRFAHETSFEWLVGSAEVIPLVLQSAGCFVTIDDKDTTKPTSTVAASWAEEKFEERKKSQEWGCSKRRKLDILHFGAGTSSLGKDVQLALDEWLHEGAERRGSGSGSVESDKVGCTPELRGSMIEETLSKVQGPKIDLGKVNRDGLNSETEAPHNKGEGRRVSGPHSLEWDVRVIDADYVADSIRPAPNPPTVGSAAPNKQSLPLLPAHSQTGTSQDVTLVATLTPAVGTSTNLRERSPLAEGQANDLWTGQALQQNKTDNQPKVINLDVLSPLSLSLNTPKEGFEMFLDKSTADAISCGAAMAFPRELGSWRERLISRWERLYANEVEIGRQESAQESSLEMVDPLPLLLLSLYSASTSARQHGISSPSGVGADRQTSQDPIPKIGDFAPGRGHGISGVDEVTNDVKALQVQAQVELGSSGKANSPEVPSESLSVDEDIKYRESSHTHHGDENVQHKPSRWVSISYSSTRCSPSSFADYQEYRNQNQNQNQKQNQNHTQQGHGQGQGGGDTLANPETHWLERYGWRVVERRFLASRSMPEGRIVREWVRGTGGGGGGRGRGGGSKSKDPGGKHESDAKGKKSRAGRQLDGKVTGGAKAGHVEHEDGGGQQAHEDHAGDSMSKLQGGNDKDGNNDGNDYDDHSGNDNTNDIQNDNDTSGDRSKGQGTSGHGDENREVESEHGHDAKKPLTEEGRPTGSSGRNGRWVERVVWEPEVGVWGWVLESVELD